MSRASNLRNVPGWAPSLAIAAAAGLLYLALPSHRHHADGIANIAVLAETNAPLPLRAFLQLCLPSHLLFDLAAVVLWKMLVALGYAGRALYALTTADSILAAAGVGLMAGLARRIAGERRTAFLCALGLAASGGYWMYANNLEDILLSVVLFIGAYRLAVTALQSASRTGWLLSGSLAGLSILAHNTSAVMAGSLLVLALAAEGRRLRSGALFGISLAIATAGPLLLVGGAFGRFGDLSSFGEWIFFTQNLGYWGGWRFDPDLLAVTLGQILIWQKSLWMGGAWVGLAVLAAWAVARALRSPSSEVPPSSRILFLSLAAWIVPVFLFGIYWHAGDPEFFMPALPAVWLWLAIGARGQRLRGAFAAAVATLAGFLFWVNLLATAVPDSDPDRNLDLARTHAAARHLEPGDLLITPAFQWPYIYLPYFADADVLGLVWLELSVRQGGPDLPERLARRTEAAWAQGHRVWLHTWPDPDAEPWREFARIRGDLEEITEFLAAHPADPARPAFEVNGEAFYRLTDGNARGSEIMPERPNPPASSEN